jgi:hypothetical protein
MLNVKPLKIEADLMWAFLDKPNDQSGKYQVDLCNLSEKAIKALESVGAQVRNKEGKGFFVTGKSIRPIIAKDPEGNTITGKVGNGSRGVALLTFYDHQNSKKYGLGVGINQLVVTDMIEYNPGAVISADDDDVL